MSEGSQLEEINIRALGVIEEASLQLSSGFTVFSGETGAGKTMVLTALSLVLGGKVDTSLLRQGKDRLIASATFRVNDAIASAAAERGAVVEDHELILTRTLSADGRSKAAAGGVSVPSSVLSDLGERLVEIHGQAASLTLSRTTKQRELVDNYAGAKFSEVFERYRVALDEYQELKQKIAALRKSATGREREVAALREFAVAFAKVKPRLNEASSLVQEILRLSSVETLRMSVGEAARVLDGEETGVLLSLATAKRSLESVADKDPLLVALLDSVSESYFLLTDATQGAHRYLENLDMDPERLEAAQLRRSEINALLKRFADASDPDSQILELNSRFNEVEEKIADLSGGEERLAVMQHDLEKLFTTLSTCAAALSKLRSDFALKLSKSVTTEIHALAMPHTQFIVSVNSPNYSARLDESAVSAHGCDDISMALQMRSGGPLIPLAKGASGGELSRVMLALEVVLAHSAPVGTYIFDEVDSGVGGKAAIEVGRRLYELSRRAQVIVVTHLPQVAAWADSHFVLQKNQDGAVDQSSVTKVSGEARIQEIARMLAGHESSKSAREHAAELLAMRAQERG